MTDANTQLSGNVGYLVWILSTRWRATFDRALAPLGLTQAQYSVLAPLYGMCGDGIRPSQRELADATRLDTVYVSKLVRALERAGLVTRTTHEADPRAVQLALTPAGVATAEQALGTVYALRDRLTAPLGGNSGERTAQLAALLSELLEVNADV